MVWNAPFVDPDNPTQGRVHSITETSRVFRFLMERGIRAIVFCKVGTGFQISSDHIERINVALILFVNRFARCVSL